ncbi:hypothetical protein [uncultured Salinisphaera sp.]|uniref:hypothetical protein n=1 Tax=uncultured Salinisphaera sp. TaxID=359372 RepID=UPI0032B215E0|tara:strand:- start:64 stop:594 length:531 start_codon:yes stop_codon:yes gene_type:complete
MSVFKPLVGSLVLAMGVAGCASSPSVDRYPAAHTDVPAYDGFLAYGAFKDLSVEGRFEKALCARLMQAGHACTPMLAVATPTSPQDSASRQRAMQASGAQAALIVELLDPETTSRRLLADGRPAYRVSVIDIDSQALAAQLVIGDSKQAHTLKARAKAVAEATTGALADAGWLAPR